MPNIQLEGDLLSGGDSSGPEVHHVRVNGKRISLLGTLSTGQNGFNPSPSIEGSSFVTVNGVPIVLAGAKYAPHANAAGVVQQETAVGNPAAVSASN